MNKKPLVIVFIIIILILGGIFLKMKYDEMKYYDEQKERIILFMKYNVKGFKEIQFEEQKENSMDGYSISGYINNDKKLSFTAGIRSVDDFQFDTDISYTDELGRKFNKNPKSVSEIKKEQNTSNK
ncbi:exported protein [Staphylococcus aureus]|nr:exported protein [Staphylococcus aureus]